MRNIIISLAAFTAAGAFAAGPAFAADDLRVSMPGDSAMTCDQLSAESARMNVVMGKSAEGAANAENGAKAANLAASAAINGALYSGALGRVPGLGMFANGAASMAQKNAADKAKAHEALMQTAGSRQAVMDALYQAKACNAASAQTTPASAPAAAPAAKPVV